MSQFDWAGLLPATIGLLLSAVMLTVAWVLANRQYRRIQYSRLRAEARLAALNARAVAQMIAAAREVQLAERRRTTSH